MKNIVVIIALFGLVNAGDLQQPAAVVGPPAQVSPILKSSPPANYAKQVPAAAIRNVESVDVKKTITPVVTKTTTHQTHSEPALSVGHVSGYTQTHVGEPKFAEVHYNTHYTQYLNPTVGVNGPVTYTGPAVSEGVAETPGVAVSQVAAVAQPVYQAPLAAPAQYHQYQYASAGPVQVPAQYAAPGPAHIPAQYAAAPVQTYAATPQAFLSSYYQVQPAYFSSGYESAPVIAKSHAPLAAPFNSYYSAPPAFAKSHGPIYSSPAAPVSAVNAAPYQGQPFLGAVDAASLLSASGYHGNFGF